MVRISLFLSIILFHYLEHDTEYKTFGPTSIPYSKSPIENIHSLRTNVSSCASFLLSRERGTFELLDGTNTCLFKDLVVFLS